MKDHVKNRFSKAVKLIEEKDFGSARQLLLQLAEEDPNSTAILAVLGDVCWEMQLLDEAVFVFKRAIELSPKLEAVSLGLFHSLWKLEKREEALEETKRFMAISDSADYREIIREINEKC